MSVSFIFSPPHTDGRCLYGPGVSMSSSWKTAMNKSGTPGGRRALTVNIDAGDEYILARRETLTCAAQPQWILITDATAVSSVGWLLPARRVSRKNWLIVDHPKDCWWLAGLESDYNCWNKHDEYTGKGKLQTFPEKYFLRIPLHNLDHCKGLCWRYKSADTNLAHQISSPAMYEL